MSENEHTFKSEDPSSPPTAAQLQAINNRLTLTPEIIRRIAEVAGYDKIAPNGELRSVDLTEAIDLTDLTELLLLSQLADAESGVSEYRRREMFMARRVLSDLLSGRALSRKQVHDLLPSDETTVLLRMGPVRAVTNSVLDYTPRLGKSNDPRNGTDSPERQFEAAWRMFDSENISHLVADAPSGPTSPSGGYPRVRIGMSLADGPEAVWSSARGYWRLKPDTRYVVPSRYGWCPFVFKVCEGDWLPLKALNEANHESVKHSASGNGKRKLPEKFYARKASLIDLQSGKLVPIIEPENLPRSLQRSPYFPVIDPHNSDVTKASDKDMAVARAISGQTLRLGAASTNSVLRIRQRGRKLYK